jgi:hypothetical protein
MRMNPIRHKWLMAEAGGVLLLLALGLLYTNEHGVVAWRQAMARHGGAVLDLGAGAHPDADRYGRMVRVSGTPQVVEPPRDRQFNVSAVTPQLLRQVQMFQWREVGSGAGRHYEMDWVDHAVDASRFAQPQGHDNQGAFPFDSAGYFAPGVRLADYRLAPAIVHALPGAASVIRADLAHIPANLAATFQAVDGALVTSAHPGSPQLGDLRVRWAATPLQPVTVVARVDGDTLVPAEDAGDGAGFQVQLGDRPLRDVLPDLPAQPGPAWIWRVLALLIGWAGAVLLLRGPRSRRGDAWAALAVAVAPLAVLAAIVWFVASVAVGVVLLAVALLAAALAWMRLRPHPH